MCRLGRKKPAAERRKRSSRERETLNYCSNSFDRGDHREPSRRRKSGIASGKTKEGGITGLIQEKDVEEIEKKEIEKRGDRKQHPSQECKQERTRGTPWLGGQKRGEAMFPVRK